MDEWEKLNIQLNQVRDQINAELREAERLAIESKDRAIKYHRIAHRIYAGVVAFDAAVIIWLLIEGHVSWIMLASMTFVSVCWGFSVRRLHHIRDDSYQPPRILRRYTR